MYAIVLTPGIRLILLIASVCLTIGAIQRVNGQDGHFMDEELLAELPKLEAELAVASSGFRSSSTEWSAYGRRISQALASHHDGLRQGALRMIIQYGPELNLGKAAAIDAVRIYRNHRNDRIRRMAVVALGRMEEPWSMDFLRRSFSHEKTPSVRHTLGIVVSTYYAGRGGDVEVGEPERVP